MKVFMPSLHPRRTRGFGESLRVTGGELKICGPTFAFDVGSQAPATTDEANLIFGQNVSAYEAEEILDDPPDVFVVGWEGTEKQMFALFEKVHSRHPCVICFYSGNFNSKFTWDRYDGGICTDRATETIARYVGVPTLRFCPMFSFEAFPYTPIQSTEKIIFRSYINAFEDRYPFSYKLFSSIKNKYQTESWPNLLIENVTGVTLDAVVARMTESVATLHIKDQEGFGWSVLESMAVGRPLILQRGLARNMTLERWALEGKTALYFKSVDDLAEIFHRLHNPDYVKELHWTTAQLIRKLYDPYPSARELGLFLKTLHQMNRFRWHPGSRGHNFVTHVEGHRAKLDPTKGDGFEILNSFEGFGLLVIRPINLERHPAAVLDPNTGRFTLASVAPREFVTWGPWLSLRQGTYQAVFNVAGSGNWALEADVFESDHSGGVVLSSAVVQSGQGPAVLNFTVTNSEAKLEFRIRASSRLQSGSLEIESICISQTNSEPH